LFVVVRYFVRDVGVIASGGTAAILCENSYILQVRYEPHVS